jgi:NAD(P)-dependent dehydrogenase (short-subunit alcohol dehydrogenase family)
MTAQTGLPYSQRLAGKVAIVTGGAGGIGRSVCERLSAEGAGIAIFDINDAGAADTCALVAKGGGKANHYHVDVSVRESVAKAMTAVSADFGGLDILVNNAGLAFRSSFLEIKDEDWNRIIALNLTGYFIVGQEAARLMVRNGGGRIVNVASLAAHMATDLQAAYSAAKGGVIALTQVMAFELAPQGINVNAVSPGPVETEMSAKNLTGATRRAREQRIPQGRLARTGELASAIAFLVSPDASYVNGTTLMVDGGLLTAGIRE